MHAWAEVLPSITEQQNHRLQHSPHTNSISNSAILRNNHISLLSDLCACVHVKKKWHRKGSHSSSVGDSNGVVWLQTWKKAMGCTAQWKMLLFCVKTIMKESRKFELARLKKKKKKKEKHFDLLATFWLGTFAIPTIHHLWWTLCTL